MAFLNRKTKRLRIRPLELRDFEVWKRTHLSMLPERNTWDRGPRPEKELTKAEFRKLLSVQKKHRQKDYFFDFAIFDSKGNWVGLVALMEISRGLSHTAFLGYRMFNNFWGLGYGKEAVRAGLDIGFRDLKLHRIEAGIEPGNTRSLRLARSLRMRREGVKKRALYLREKWVDLVMYTLTTEDVGIKFDTSQLRPRTRS